jgi:hypothetical protein
MAKAIRTKTNDPNVRRTFIAAAIEGWENAQQPGVMDFIQGLGVGDERQRAIRGFARRRVLRDGIDGAYLWADSLSEDEKIFKLNVIRRVTSDAARIDPVETSSWVKKYDGTYFMRSLPQRVSMHWAKTDPLAALAWLEGLEPGINRNEGVREGFRSWARREYDAAIEWLLTGEHQAWKDEALALYARRLQLGEPEKAADAASKIVDHELRVHTQVVIARTWAVQDEAAAQEWVANEGRLTEKEKHRALTYGLLWRQGVLASMEKRAELDDAAAQARLDDWSDPDAEPIDETGDGS